MKKLLAMLTALAIVGFAKVVTGLRAIWIHGAPQADQTIYVANHSSHGDFVLIWAALPSDLRVLTRPVAGADYWDRPGLRGFIGKQVFRALLISRDGGAQADNPVEAMTAVLASGDSLILFPEGTRNTSDEILLPLKSGIFRLVQRYPEARVIPVWIENLKRVLPKGQFIPVPLACTVRFGQALPCHAQDTRETYLERLRLALLDLRPEYDKSQGAQG
jgi:1-acyl-sn-glycerol-3-phosphate acyltransferase